MTKNELRQRMASIRNSLNKQEITVYSEAIFDNLLKIPAFCEYHTLLCYIHIKSEVATGRIIKYYQKHHKKTAAPKVAGSTMDFFYFDDTSELSDDNPYHIPEPVSADRCIPDTDTVIIMPGLVFDESGARIGYGGGYYDKYLAKYHNVVKIAVAYDFQVIKHIDETMLEDTDIKPDYIVTEKRIILICR